MVISANESLAEFHSRLVKQAKNCGFTVMGNSFEERMLRDRLILAVSKKQRDRLLSLKPNPTVPDILKTSHMVRGYNVSDH